MPPIVPGILSLICIIVLCTALGRRLLRAIGVDCNDVAERGVLALGLGFGALQAVPFVLFSIGVGRPVVFRTVVLILGAVLAPDIAAFFRAAGRWLRVPRGLTIAEWFLFATIGALLVLIFPRALCPITDSDSLAYHLTCAQRTLQEGRFVFLPTLVYTTWPSSTEFQYAFLLGIDRSAPVALIPFVLGLVAVGAAYLIGRQAGGRFVGATAAAFLLIYPRFWWETASGMVDVAGAAFATLSVAAVIRSRSEEGWNPRWLALSALFAGFAATTKLSAVWVIASMALVLTMEIGARGQGLRTAARYIAIGSAVVIPWYVRTWALTGNPLYPALYRVFGGREWTAGGWDRFHSYHWQFNTWPGFEPTPAVLFWSHWAHAGIAATIALLVAWATRRSRAAIPARFAAFYVASNCAFGIFGLRYVMAGFPAAMSGLAIVVRRRERVLAPVLCIIAAWLAWTINVRKIEPDLSTALRYAIGAVGRDAYLESRVQDYSIVEYANRYLPERSRLVIGTPSVHTAYYRFPAFWADYWRQDSIHYDSPQRLESDLARLGVTHLVFEPTYPLGSDTHLADRVRLRIELPMLADLARRHGEKLFETNGVTLYRLNLTAVRR